MEGPLAEPLDELRSTGFLTPLKGYGDDGGKTRVYYFPPPLAPALRLIGAELRSSSSQRIKRALNAVGYKPRPRKGSKSN